MKVLISPALPPFLQYVICHCVKINKGLGFYQACYTLCWYIYAVSHFHHLVHKQYIYIVKGML